MDIPHSLFGGLWTSDAGGEVSNTWQIGRVTVLRRGAGSPEVSSWTLHSSESFMIDIQTSLGDRLEAVIEGGVLS